jgi:hypothetical protein
MNECRPATLQREGARWRFSIRAAPASSSFLIRFRSHRICCRKRGACERGADLPHDLVAGDNDLSMTFPTPIAARTRSAAGHRCGDTNRGEHAARPVIVSRHYTRSADHARLRSTASRLHGPAPAKTR